MQGARNSWQSFLISRLFDEERNTSLMETWWNFYLLGAHIPEVWPFPKTLRICSAAKELNETSPQQSPKSIVINAVQIRTSTAFLVVLRKDLILKRCFKFRKKVSISHPERYNKAILLADSAFMFVNSSTPSSGHSLDWRLQYASKAYRICIESAHR